MPTTNDLLTNTQGQTNTVSSNGSNRVAKFRGKSYFFLEDGNFTQSSTQAFGVVSDDAFYTTACVTASNKKVIAVCTGQIFVQPQSGTNADPNKVNVILRPYKQPINGLAVKYFVYRGLPKADFFDANGKVNAAGTGATGLVNYIRNEFASFYSGTTVPDFWAKYIGFPDTSSTQAETDYIDSYFYKVSQSFAGETGAQTDPKLAFELPMIPAGTHIATANGEIGFDIVLSDGDYYIENDTNPFRPDLKFARSARHLLNVATVSDVYQKKVLREACTRFLDAAAYYGIHANGGSIYKYGQTTAIDTAANIAALIANFYTKNNIYIYIQSNRQRSYNFYDTQKISNTNTNNIKIGIAENSLTETTFETSKWPVKVFNTAPSGGSTEQTIVLKLTTDRGARTSLLSKLGNIASSNQEGFVDTNLLIEPVSGDGSIISYFTQAVRFTSPINSGQNIASFIQLAYIGKSIILTKPGDDDGDPNTPIPAPVLFTAKYMDDVFYLINATSFLQANGIYHVHSYEPVLYSQQEIEKKRNKVVSYTQRTQTAVTTTEATSLILYTYLSIVENEQSSHSNYGPNVSSNKEATGYGIQSTDELNTLSVLPGNEFLEQKNFTDSDQVIKGLALKTVDRSLPTTLGLGISEPEHNILKALLVNARNPKIYFDPVFANDQFFTSAENVKFKKFRLGILSDTVDFKQEILLPPADTIYVYSIDSLFFFSKEYANNIRLEVTKKYPFESNNIA